jgi:hypothetical protein
MLAAVEAADVGCKRRRSPAMAEENPGGDNILRGSANPPTSTGESILLRYIEKGLQYIWRRRITSLSQLPALNCCTCSCCNGSKAAAIAALFLSTLLHTLTFSLLSFCFSSSTTTAAHGLIHLSMVGATTIDKW